MQPRQLPPVQGAQQAVIDAWNHDIKRNPFYIAPKANSIYRMVPTGGNWDAALNNNQGGWTAHTGFTYEADPDALADYVARETGIAAGLQYAEGALRMLANPDQQYAAFKHEVAQKMLAASAGYAADLEELALAGLPEESQKRVALQKARANLEGELSLLKLKYPLAMNTDLLATATVKGGSPIHIPNPFGGAPAGKTISDEKYAKYKKYKAKKAAAKGSK